MRPLEKQTPPGAVASGETGVDRGIDKANGATHGAVEIAQRRAASIRMQAIGRQGGA